MFSHQLPLNVEGPLVWHDNKRYFYDAGVRVKLKKKKYIKNFLQSKVRNIVYCTERKDRRNNPFYKYFS